MKKYIKIIFVITICIFITLNTASCKNAHELNKLAIVMGVAIDKSSDLNKIQTTIQVAKVSSIGKSSSNLGVSDISKNYINYKGDGYTLMEAITSINRKLNRRLFFPHNQVIIISKEAAEEGVGKYLDFFLRNRETRLLEWIVVSDAEASKILDVKPDMESTTGRSIGELIKMEKDVTQVPTVDLKEFTQKLMSKSASPVAAIVKIIKEDNKDMIMLTGTAVFNKDKMAGQLNKKETRGFLWGTGEMKGEIILVPEPENKGMLSLQITKSSAKITPEIKENKIYMNMKISEEGDLGEQTSNEDEANPESFKEIQKSAEEAIKNEVMDALKKSKELNSDIFGFGDTIYQHYPKEWVKLESNWKQVYQDIIVNITVEAKLDRTGRITKPAMSKEK